METRYKTRRIEDSSRIDASIRMDFERELQSSFPPLCLLSLSLQILQPFSLKELARGCSLRNNRNTVSIFTETHRSEESMNETRVFERARLRCYILCLNVQISTILSRWDVEIIGCSKIHNVYLTASISRPLAIIHFLGRIFPSRSHFSPVTPDVDVVIAGERWQRR